MGELGIFLWATALCGYDSCFRRLPNWLTLPGAALSVVGAWMVEPPLILGGVVWSGFYLLLRLVGSSGIGGGDVKLAFPLGILAATQGMLGVLGVNLLASLFSAVGAAVRRRKAVAHGPSMLAATWLVVAPLQLGAGLPWAM